jgi:hypothetical protein
MRERDPLFAAGLPLLRLYVICLPRSFPETFRLPSPFPAILAFRLYGLAAKRLAP